MTLSVAPRAASSRTLVPGTGIAEGQLLGSGERHCPPLGQALNGFHSQGGRLGRMGVKRAVPGGGLSLPRLRETSPAQRSVRCERRARSGQGSPSLMLQTRSSPLWSGSIRESLIRHLILICYMNSKAFTLDIKSEFLNRSVLSLCPCSDCGGLWQDSDRWPLAHFLLVLCLKACLLETDSCCEKQN